MFFVEVLFEQQAPPQKTSQESSQNDQLKAPKVNKNEPSDDSQYDAQQNQDQENYSDDLEDEDLESTEEEPQATENFLPSDLAPIKRYYLIQKLKELSTTLSNYNIKNDDLELVLKFVNDLSYPSLMILGSGVIQTIEDQLARLSNGQGTEA